MRQRVEARDVPPLLAARRLGLKLPAFELALPDLKRRGFPPADPTTGNFDLQAIDRWCDLRNQHLFSEPEAVGGRDARDVVAGRIAAL